MSDLYTDRLAYRVPEVCRMLGISKSMFYKLTQAGKISTLKLGSMTLVKRTELERLIDGKENEWDAPTRPPT
jgi:excisionase family DNA binding protein